MDIISLIIGMIIGFFIGNIGGIYFLYSKGYISFNLKP